MELAALLAVGLATILKSLVKRLLGNHQGEGSKYQAGLAIFDSQTRAGSINTSLGETLLVQVIVSQVG